MTVTNTNLDTFDQDVLAASKQRPVLVDFWAEWCAPCLVIAPVLEKVIDEMKGAVMLAKVEVDYKENMKLAGRYQVRGFPTVILFQGAEETARFSGALSRTQIKAFLRQHLESALPASRQEQ